MGWGIGKRSGRDEEEKRRKSRNERKKNEKGVEGFKNGWMRGPCFAVCKIWRAATFSHVHSCKNTHTQAQGTDRHITQTLSLCRVTRVTVIEYGSCSGMY